MKFIITIDTESGNQWGKDEDLNNNNLRFLPRFQALCEKYNFFPTYLVTYEVAIDNYAISLLGKWQKQGKAEIGAHLHPWTNPPYTKSQREKYHIYPSELTKEEFHLKLFTLTEVIAKNFSQRPTSYRAGRWGFDNKQIGSLVELGYIVDCSVTPKISWQRDLGNPKGQGGPDFRLAPVAPYSISKDNIIIPGQSDLLEAPVTILFTGPFKKENSFLARKFLAMEEGLLKNILNRLFFRQKWLRIFPNSQEKDWQKIFLTAGLLNLPMLEFMVHSSELMPGGTPYFKTKEEVERLYFQLEKMFEYFKSQGIEGCALSEFAEQIIFKNNHGKTI
jgi:hypothetical protein